MPDDALAHTAPDEGNTITAAENPGPRVNSVESSFTGFTGLFPLVVAAIYWRRLTAAGAFASILTAVVSWAYLFHRSDYGTNSGYAFPESPIGILPGLAIPPLKPIVTVTLLASYLPARRATRIRPAEALRSD